MKSRISPSRRRLSRAIAISQLETLETRTLLSDSGQTADWLGLASSIMNGDAGGAVNSIVDLARNAHDHGDDHGDGGGEDEGKKEKKPKKPKHDEDHEDDDGRPGHGPPADALPTAQIAVANVTARSDDDLAVTITYSDDKKIRAGTIGTSDITVSGPNGDELDITGVSISPDHDNNQIVATYRVAAPGGRWDSADNGGYTVTLDELQVFDTRFQPVLGMSADFDVNIVTVDNAAPTASIAVANITAAGGDSHQVKVTYSDDVGVNLASIGPRDLLITGPGGAERTVRSVSVGTPSADGKSVTATYTFDAPGGSWNAADNGTYTVALNASEVRDTSEKGATATPVTFTVNVATPQPVDPGFGGGNGGSTGGGGGTLRASFVAEAVIAQADGKLLVAGRQGSLSAGTSQAIIQRFNVDGTPDSTFGTRGRVVTASGTNDAFYSIALSASGQIVVGGARGGDVLVSRYSADGSLDTSFARGGLAVTDFGSTEDAAYAIGVAPDGSIIAAGGPNGDIAFAHYLTSGALDPGFGQGGIQMFDLGSPNDTPGAVAFQDGKVVIVGASGGKVAIVRVRADGEADETFSGDGLLLLDALASRTDANFNDRSTAAAVQADGKLLLANRSATGDFAIARLNANGALDTSFGAAGVATVDFGGDDDADAIIVQDTGEILVIGTTNAGGTANTAIAALDTSGALISDFGTGGKLTLTPDVSTASRELHVGDLVLRAFGTRQPDGRLVVGTTNAGNSQSGSGGSAGNGSGNGSGTPGQQETSLRRLNVPGTRSQPQGTQLGTFGVVDGKRATLTVTDPDGTDITFTASRGSGVVYQAGDHYNLTLSDGAIGASVSIRGTGGDGRIQLGDVTASGNLRSLIARTADLSGTLYASGLVGRIMLGDVTGNIAAAGSITLVSVSSLTGARVMAGAGLGADGKLGGVNAEADSFTAASIGAVRVAGGVEASTISAGLDPIDGVFNNDDDRVMGGEASMIRSVVARSADATSRFIAGRIVSLRLPGATDLDGDDRVRVM